MLTAYVCVTGADGMVQFGPGDDVPAWARKLITNPNVWTPELVKPVRKKAVSDDSGDGS